MRMLNEGKTNTLIFQEYHIILPIILLTCFQFSSLSLSRSKYSILLFVFDEKKYRVGVSLPKMVITDKQCYMCVCVCDE